MHDAVPALVDLCRADWIPNGLPLPLLPYLLSAESDDVHFSKDPLVRGNGAPLRLISETFAAMVSRHAPHTTHHNPLVSSLAFLSLSKPLTVNCPLSTVHCPLLNVEC